MHAVKLRSLKKKLIVGFPRVSEPGAKPTRRPSICQQCDQCVSSDLLCRPLRLVRGFFRVHFNRVS